MSTAISTIATLDDLRRVEGKAELIAGRIVHLMPTGFLPGRIGGRIFRALDDHAAATGRGVALPDNVGFVVPALASGRRSFSPDAACFLGSLPTDGMDFLDGPPTLAVEVRSKGDYAGEAALAARRADYFEAETVVVWDVDPKAEVVHVYRADAPDRPSTFARGQDVNAEPVLPGWRLAVDRIFG